jgi:hypothetical protein
MVRCGPGQLLNILFGLLDYFFGLCLYLADTLVVQPGKKLLVDWALQQLFR